MCLTGSAAASQIGFVYALQQVNNGVNQIYGFRFDPSTEALTLLPGFPVASGGTGTSTTVSEQLAYGDGRLYVLNDGADIMTAFSVNRATGALTAMPFKPVALGAGAWACVAVHPSGSPVVVGNASGGLSSFVVTDTAATAAPGSPFTTGAARPFSCRFSQDGASVYTGGSGVATTIAGFSVDAGSGVLTALAGSPFESGSNNPRGYATDSSGRLFSALFNAPQVRAFTTAAGVPTAVAGNPFASGLTNGVHGVLHPGGFYLVADQSGNRVGSYRIENTGAATTMTPAVGSPFATKGTLPRALALTRDGSHLIVANSTSRNLSAFLVGSTSGILTLVSLQSENTLGSSGTIAGLAFAPAEVGFIYALQDVSGGANQIHGFRINPDTGGLSALPGLPIGSGGTGSGSGSSEQLAYRNGRLYVVNDGNKTLTAFKVNRTSGALTPLAFSPIALGGGLVSVCVAVHPSGSPVVVGNNLGLLASFDVGATTATAAAGSPFATGNAGPFSCGFSRFGFHVYTGGSGGGSTFAGFSVNAQTGVLTPLAGSPFESGGAFPRGFAADSNFGNDNPGRVFLLNPNGGQVRAFTTSNGVPTAVSGNPFASGLIQAVHAVRHRLGFYLAADRTGNRVGVYRIFGSGAATTVTAVVGSPFAATGGSQTASLALTEDGAFLIAANSASRNLTVFEFNPSTGGLSPLATQPANTLGGTGGVSGMVFAAVVPPFIDDPLSALTSVITAVHIAELRTRIDDLRAQHGLEGFSYTNPTLTVASTGVRAVHVADLRAALAEVYVALGMAAPGYTDSTLSVGLTVVKRAHIMELRAAVIAIE